MKYEAVMYHDCPKCGAVKGTPCINRTEPHSERGALIDGGALAPVIIDMRSSPLGDLIGMCLRNGLEVCLSPALEPYPRVTRTLGVCCALYYVGQRGDRESTIEPNAIAWGKDEIEALTKAIDQHTREKR